MITDVLESDYVGADDELLARGYAFVGAVHSLVDASRSATKFDLILAAASHALRGGDKSAIEIRSVIHRVWPGAQVNQVAVTEALRLGSELGLVQMVDALEGVELWQLTARGVDDVQGQVDWVATLRTRSSEELKRRAESDLGVTITAAQSELWLERIVGALILGITSSQDAYLGRVDHLVGKRLAPRKVDRVRVLSHLDASGSDPAIVEFLKTAAVAALDPLDLFCNELVSHITTGCVLHSYVAGRDSAPVLNALGSPSGQRALIDTPVLVDLLGPARVRRTVEFTLRAAVQAGWEVIVCDHSIEELINLVTREVPRIRSDFTKAHKAGVKEEWFANLTEDQLTTYAVEVLRDGTYSSLEQMVTAAESIEVELARLGVEVRPHFNDADRSYVDRCRAALDAELDGSYRSPTVVQRDAESMAVVWRRRRREPKKGHWPGGWVITPDRHLGAAFASLDRAHSVPITLSLSQWSTLLSVTIAPTDVVALAEAAATQLVEEAMWLLPSRYPSDVALQLAERLAPASGGSETEIRYAQVTLDLALDDDRNARSANAIAADVLAARTKRRDRLAEIQVETSAKAVVDAEAARAAAQALAIEKSNEIASARLQADEDAKTMQGLQSELNWQRSRVGRIAWSAFFAIVGVGALVVAVILGAWLIVLVGMVLGLALGGLTLFRWCTEESASLTRLVWAGIVEGLGLLAAAVGLFVDLRSLS
jgi:hypothetical protein